MTEARDEAVSGALPRTRRTAKRSDERDVLLGVDPHWYKDAIIYELHVRSFFDSDGDGIGDFRGLTEKLDYIRDLGVTAIWLLPFYPSPLRDDGYDIGDYLSIHSMYGNMADFKRFLGEAHKRGLRVITELVINHTSDQHPWFQRARRAKKGSKYRDFYVWSDSADRYLDARIIFQDFETSNWGWDPVAKAYYWHRFYGHQPDLNYDNPAVHKAVFQVLDFWMRLGVDALRLDAIPYLYQREGTNCENLPETHDFLRKLRAHVDGKFNDRMLLAEANQWPEDSVAYFGDGDECHMNFHFPLMPRLYMALQQEDRFPIADILDQTPQIPESCQWALFLRNHDELTLEMVSDEERDTMWRTYAQQARARINLGIRRRLAPLLDNNRRRIELMNCLLFSLPGTPVLYYGDEIGMGDNFYLGDRNGMRTPMQWSGDRNAGFSRANPQQLFLPVVIDPEYHYEAINVEAQQQNPSSLLWWTKRLIALRKRSRAFGRGTIELLHPDNRKVLAFLRSYGEEEILVVANLSRFTQCSELELPGHEGRVPVELFGQTHFPPITKRPYFFTLGPHTIYWFALETREASERPWDVATPEATLSVSLPATSRWEDVFGAKARARLLPALEQFLRKQRWFRGKAGVIRGSRLREVVPVRLGPRYAHLLLLDVDYVQGESETYLIPVAVQGVEVALREHYPEIARISLEPTGEEGILYDATHDREVMARLLRLVANHGLLRGEDGEVRGSATPRLRRGVQAAADLEPRVMRAEQSNTSVVFGSELVIKLFRKLEPGESLDAEVGRFLTERGFEHTPFLGGVLDYQRSRAERMTLGTVQEYVANEGDAWQYTLDAIGRYFEHVLARRAEGGSEEAPRSAPQGTGEVPVEAERLIGPYLESARLIGRRTAEMHQVLARETEDPAFVPEPFTQLYQRSLYQSMRNMAIQSLDLLQRREASLPDVVREAARRVIGLRPAALARLRTVMGAKIDTVRVRTHGDYHLGQLLYTGKDFVITDFEGEPARPLSERRIKRSPLRDVAGMLRSYHYAAYTGLFRVRESGLVGAQQGAVLDGWADYWVRYCCDLFLRGYAEVAEGAPFWPVEPVARQRLLDAYQLDKALYELAYELNNRPAWLVIPLSGILRLLADWAKA